VPDLATGNYCGRPLVADIDGDGRAEIVVGDDDGWLTCFEGRGSLRWRVKMPDAVDAMPCPYDVNGDGAPEIVVSCANDRLYCLRATAHCCGWRR